MQICVHYFKFPKMYSQKTHFLEQFFDLKNTVALTANRRQENPIKTCVK